MHGDTWQLQEAKARFSEVVRAVKETKKPQVITVHGKKEVMVVPYKKAPAAKSARNKKKPKTLWDVLKPLRKLNFSDKEVEDMFGRDRNAPARGTDEPLFD